MLDTSVFDEAWEQDSAFYMAILEITETKKQYYIMLREPSAMWMEGNVGGEVLFGGSLSFTMESTRTGKMRKVKWEEYYPFQPSKFLHVYPPLRCVSNRKFGICGYTIEGDDSVLLKFNDKSNQEMRGNLLSVVFFE
jgi:hypothetical protein